MINQPPKSDNFNAIHSFITSKLEPARSDLIEIRSQIPNTKYPKELLLNYSNHVFSYLLEIKLDKKLAVDLSPIFGSWIFTAHATQQGIFYPCFNTPLLLVLRDSKSYIFVDQFYWLFRKSSCETKIGPVLQCLEENFLDQWKGNEFTFIDLSPITDPGVFSFIAMHTENQKPFWFIHRPPLILATTKNLPTGQSIQSFKRINL